MIIFGGLAGSPLSANGPEATEGLGDLPDVSDLARRDGEAEVDRFPRPALYPGQQLV